MSNPPPSSASKHSGTPSPNADASPAKTHAGIYNPLPRGAMTADNTQGTITRAIGFIDRFFEFQGVEERFLTLTDAALE